MTRLASQNASAKQAKQLRRRNKRKLNDLWLIFLRVWILLLWSSNLCGEGGSWRRGCALCHWNCGQHIVLGTLRPCCRVLVHAQGVVTKECVKLRGDVVYVCKSCKSKWECMCCHCLGKLKGLVGVDACMFVMLIVSKQRQKTRRRWENLLLVREGVLHAVTL